VVDGGMAGEQDSISRILSTLSHPLRREILLRLSENGEQSFTDLMNFLKTDTGKLSFHIRNLVSLIEQTPTGKYVLTKSGENAVRLIKDLEAWVVEVDVARNASLLPLASLAKRVYAFLIDFALILSIFAVTAVLSVGVGGGFRLDFNTIFLFVAVLWLYSTLFEGFGGQTLGKRLIGLTVIRVDNKRMFYDHAAVRNIGKIFVLLPFDLLIGHRLNDKRFMRYFDKFAGTTVINLRPE
jgi:uncharacterized RDD family membrane protein YckC